MNISHPKPDETWLPNEASLEFRVFDSAQSLLPIVPAWQALASQCHTGYSFFCSPHWVMNWLDAFPDHRLRLVTVWRGGMMVLMAPMADCSIAGWVRQWCCASFPEAGYGGVLVCPSEEPAELTGLLLEFLKDQAEADILVFPSVPNGTAWLPVAPSVQTPAAGAYATMMDVRKDANVANSKSSRRNLKRKRQKLAGESELTLEKIDHTHPLAGSIIDTMIDWKIAWLDERALVGASVRSQPFRVFLKNLMSDGGAMNANTPFCLALCRDGEPVTASLFLPDANILHCYFTAFDPACGEHSPGMVLIQEALDWMRKTDWVYYDFEGFPEPYKDKLATDRVPLADHAFALSKRGSLIVQWRRVQLRQRIKALFYKLPPSIRNVILSGVKK
ncbi:MAG: GNAT family N-acetyltransferase [Pseudomonadota bacterium]